MARREERAYREYVSDEQRSQPGCPARELCDESLLQDTSSGRKKRAHPAPVGHGCQISLMVQERNVRADDPGGGSGLGSTPWFDRITARSIKFGLDPAMS